MSKLQYDFSDTLFNPYINTIFSGQNNKDLSVDDRERQELSQYLNFVYNGSDISKSYHYSILKQAQNLTVVFSVLFCLVTAFICVMVGFIVLRGYDAKLLIPLIISALADLISGGLIVVMKNLSKSRDDFFKENIKADYFAKIIGLIQTVNNENDRLFFIREFIDGYCEYFYKDSAKAEYFTKLVELVNAIQDESKKIPLLEKLIDGFLAQKEEAACAGVLSAAAVPSAVSAAANAVPDAPADPDAAAAAPEEAPAVAETE